MRFSDEKCHHQRLLHPSQVLSFGSLDYVADYNGELHPLEETLLEDSES
jgi:hypothetical protein